MPKFGSASLLSGDQSLAGVKTFVDAPVMPTAGFKVTGNVASIGAVNASVTGTLTVSESRYGDFFKLTFTLTSLRIAVTDAGASGSSGSTKLFDFAEGAIAFLGSRQNYTAFAEGAALTGAMGDAAFVIALGTDAADAGDGALTGDEVNAGATLSLTNSSGTSAGEKVTGPTTLGAKDGTGTAADLYLNWSGTAATIDANSTIDVTGTVTVWGVFMGDD